MLTLLLKILNIKTHLGNIKGITQKTKPRIFALSISILLCKIKVNCSVLIQYVFHFDTGKKHTEILKD